MTKTNLTEHGFAANARMEDISVKMLKDIKGEFPISSHAGFCQLAGLDALEMSGGPDPFDPQSEHAGSLDLEVSGVPEITRQESELAGSVAVEVSGGPEIPRQESELAGFVAVHMSGVSDIPFQPEIELTDSVNTKMFGGLDTVSQPERELAGSMTVKVSGEHAVHRQESEIMEAAEEIFVPIDDMQRIIELNTNCSRRETKIHEFPQGLRRSLGQDNCYICPSVLALGPNYHELPQLQAMEEKKRAAAHYLCARLGASVGAVYDNIRSIVPEARSCYVDTDVARFSDKDFAGMMFLDGCFLLRYITEDGECALENRMTLPPGPCMLRDIFLLENQLPWLVLEALVTSNYDSVYQFVARMAKSFDITACPETVSFANDSYKPPHLLALLRHHLIGSLPAEDFISSGIHPSLTISAVELAEIGVKLTASNKKTWFADTSIQRGLLSCKLSLTPLFLNGYTACWLVNMVAFESTSYLSDGYTICSYVSLLAMLMDKVEDVHALRTHHVLHSSFSNQETLDFFKGLAHDLPLGRRYKAIQREIEEYKCQRALRIVVYKFIYNNYKTIATLFSVGGALSSIFFGLMSLKQHQ